MTVLRSSKFFVSYRNKLDRWFKENKNSLDLKHCNDLYISEHACERMLERGLEKDKNFCSGNLEIFYGTCVL